MGYIETFEAELARKLETESDDAALIRWISEKVLESYRNGLSAGKKGVEPIRQGKSRRRAGYGNAQESAAQ